MKKWLRTTFVTLLLTIAAVWGASLLSKEPGTEAYEPQVGDVVFQSLGSNAVTDLIAGSTHSPFTHCGMVVLREGRWHVLEAIGPVREIPLADWIAQGQRGGVAVFRLRAEFQSSVPKFVESARTFLGRPYDPYYRFDDERIYCSELVFKAWRSATGTELGRVRKVRELDWEPYRAVIERIERGPVPLERELITPRDLSEAPQLREVYRTGI